MIALRLITGCLLAVSLVRAQTPPSNVTDAEIDAGSLTMTLEIAHSTHPRYIAPPPPSSLGIGNDTGTAITLTWPAVDPGAGRTIDHYDVYLNGRKVGSTSSTSYDANYSPSSAQLQFYSIVAIDDRGTASPPSAEVATPRPFAYASVDVKEFYGAAQKYGVYAQGDWYRSENHHYVFHKTLYDAYSDVIGSMSGNVDASITCNPLDGTYTRTVSGQMSGSTISPPDSGSTFWRLNDAKNAAILDDPTFWWRFQVPVGQIDLSDMSYDNWLTSYPQQSQVDSSGSNDDYDYHDWLSDKFSDGDLRSNAANAYATAKGAAAGIQWNFGISVSLGKLGSPFGLDSPSPYAAGYHEGPQSNPGLGTISEHGSYYRITNGNAFASDFVWGEVTYPDSPDDAPTIVVRQAHLEPGASTGTFMVDAPAIPGDIVIGTDFRLNIRTPSQQPVAGAPRLFDATGIFVGQAALLDVSLGTTGVYSNPGDDCIRLVAITQYDYYSKGIDAAIAAGQEIVPGDDIAYYVNLGYLIAVVGKTPGTAVVSVDVGGSSLTQKVTVYPLPHLAVDANHDGVIDAPTQDAAADYADTTTPDAPYRFWLNDDSDAGDVKVLGTDDFSLAPGANGRNCDDNVVNGIRDLVDFFPVYLDLKSMLAALPSGNGVSYVLKQQDAAVGIVFTSYARDHAFDYFRAAPSGLQTGFGPTLAQDAGAATVTKITADGVDLFAASPAFLSQIQQKDGGVVLVEMSKQTTAPLILEVRRGADVVMQAELALKADPVDSMFSFVNLRSFAHGTPIADNNQGKGFGSLSPTDAPNDPFVDEPNRKNVVFVHGYNVNSDQGEGSGAAVFKRLYWSGSKAKYYAVLWRGDDGQGEGLAPKDATPDYHRNVGHAWQQGPYLRDVLSSLQGDTVVMAHSLGNMVTQVALTYERDPSNAARLRQASHPSNVKNYFAIDAAVPLEALSDSDITADSKSKMRHPDWAEFDTQERLWPTNWYALFAGTTDGRANLTWRNVFAGLDVGTNFYSSGDQVLANPTNDSIPLLQPITQDGLLSWVSQEKQKGGAGPAAPFFRSRTGGWVANSAWYVPIVPSPPAGAPQTRRRFASEAQDAPAPGGVPTASLASEPFFQRFQATEDGTFYPDYQGSRLLAPVGDPNADDEARKLVTVAKCLGEAIPALSFPQGSNESARFKGQGMGGNFDLNTLAFKNSWPSSRPDTNWKHSDCLNVAYTYNFPLYDKMTNDGGLK